MHRMPPLAPAVQFPVTPSLSGVPNKGDKIRGDCLPLPSRGPTSGRDYYVTPVFSGVPKKGVQKNPHRASGKKPLKGVLKGGPLTKQNGSQRTALIRNGPQVPSGYRTPAV